MMKKWLHEIDSVTRKLCLYIIAIVIAGICSTIIGAFLSYTHTAPTWVQAQFNPAGTIVDANSLNTSGFIVSILGRNIFLSGILIATSPLQLGILDLVSLLGTSFQMGGQIIWFNEGETSLLLNGLGVFIPHAIFEVPAVVLTTAISLKLVKQ